MNRYHLSALIAEIIVLCYFVHMNKKYRLLSNNLLTIMLTTIVILVITGSIVFADNAIKPDVNKSPVAQKYSSTVKTEDEKLSHTDNTEPEVNITSPEENAKPQTSTPQSSPAPVSKPQQKATALKQQAVQPLFVVRSIKVFTMPYYYCDNSIGMVLSFPGAYAQITPGQSGIIKWQVEERVNGVAVVNSTGTGTVPQNYGMYEITAPGGLYKSRPSGPDPALRLHITSPNEIISEWYIPTTSPGCVN
jgi:hypothetical protein